MDNMKIFRFLTIVLALIFIISFDNIFALEESSGIDNSNEISETDQLNKEEISTDTDVNNNEDVSNNSDNNDIVSDDESVTSTEIKYVKLNKIAKSNLIINVNWDIISDCEYYILYKKNNNGVILDSIKVNNNINSYDFKNLSNNTYYKFDLEGYKFIDNKYVLAYKSYVDLVGTKARKILFNESDYSYLNSFSVRPKKVKINLRTKLKEGKSGYNIVQGGCSDGTYAYYLLIKKSNDKGRILKVRISDTKVIKKSGVLNIKHGNGMACDTKNNRLAISGNGKKRNKLALVDASSLKLTKNVKISYTYLKYSSGWNVKKANGKYHGLAAITYIKKYDIYIGLQKTTHDLLVINSDFKVVAFISTNVNSMYPGLYQGIDADEKYVYLLLSPYNNTQPNNIMLVLDYNTEKLLDVINGEVSYVTKSYKCNNYFNGNPDAVIRLNNPNEAENIYHVPVNGKNHFFVSEYKNKAKYHWVKKKKKVKVKWKKVTKKVKVKTITKSGKVKYKYKKKKVWKYKKKWKKVKVYEFHYYKKDGYVYDLGTF